MLERARTDAFPRAAARWRSTQTHDLGYSCMRTPRRGRSGTETGPIIRHLTEIAKDIGRVNLYAINAYLIKIFSNCL